jgi:hypothetical protein
MMIKMLALVLLVVVSGCTAQPLGENHATGTWSLSYTPVDCTSAMRFADLDLEYDGHAINQIPYGDCNGGSVDVTGDDELTVTCHTVTVPEGDVVWTLADSGDDPTAHYVFTRTSNGCVSEGDALVERHDRP